MVAICPKCRKVWGCVSEDETLVFVCDACEDYENCLKDREEFAVPQICPKCIGNPKQLKLFEDEEEEC
jgi:hypothetical protein